MRFFVTGKGTAIRSIATAINTGQLNSQICLLISNNENSSALDWARPRGIDTLLIAGTEANDSVLCLERLKRHEIDLILLTGYMRMIDQPILDQYFPKIWNIHPALLPQYGGKGMYGKHVHRAVLDAKEKRTGATIHVVDPEYDSGPILLQSSIITRDDDTAESLADRVKALECELLIEGINRAENGELDITLPVPFETP